MRPHTDLQHSLKRGDMAGQGRSSEASGQTRSEVRDEIWEADVARESEMNARLQLRWGTLDAEWPRLTIPQRQQRLRSIERRFRHMFAESARMRAAARARDRAAARAECVRPDPDREREATLTHPRSRRRRTRSRSRSRSWVLVRVCAEATSLSTCLQEVGSS